jgi:hypothetical protein
MEGYGGAELRYQMKMLLQSIAAGMVLVMGSTGLGEGQMPGMSSPPVQLNPVGPPSTRNRRDPDDAIPPEVLDKQEQARNLERQRRLVEDTDKLLALATNLKAQVAKESSSVSSADEARKAEEIEKLAKSVRDHMMRS